MNNQEKVVAVANAMQPLMAVLDEFLTEQLGDNQHDIILLIGAGNEEQYAANVPRERGIESLTQLLNRWKVGMPEHPPGSITPGDTAPFKLLLDEYDAARRKLDAGAIHHARLGMIRYVGELVALANRAKS